jgi:2-keto-4-pentenoate hydratase
MAIDEAAATELARRRRLGVRGPRLPADIRPVTVAEALALQHRIASRLGVIGGWKCSVPSGERMTIAPLFAGTIHRGAHVTVPPRGDTAPIEPEIAFALRRDLPPRERAFDEDEVADAIGEAHLVLEVLGNRYDDPSTVPMPEMLADGANNEALVVGPVLEGWAGLDLGGFEVTIEGAHGFRLTHAGRHPDGHPLRPLVWLANFLRERGERLRAGQIVTTGSYAGALDVPLGMPLTVTFGALGRMAITLDPSR